jgi:hypothetical protein
VRSAIRSRSNTEASAHAPSMKVAATLRRASRSEARSIG